MLLQPDSRPREKAQPVRKSRLVHHLIQLLRLAYQPFTYEIALERANTNDANGDLICFQKIRFPRVPAL
jgi:hypothetical protein